MMHVCIYVWVCDCVMNIPSVKALIIERVIEYSSAGVHHGDPCPQWHSVTVDILMVMIRHHEALERDSMVTWWSHDPHLVSLPFGVQQKRPKLPRIRVLHDCLATKQLLSKDYYYHTPVMWLQRLGHMVTQDTRSISGQRQQCRRACRDGSARVRYDHIRKPTTYWASNEAVPRPQHDPYTPPHQQTTPTRHTPRLTINRFSLNSKANGYWRITWWLDI